MFLITLPSWQAEGQVTSHNLLLTTTKNATGAPVMSKYRVKDRREFGHDTVQPYA